MNNTSKFVIVGANGNIVANNDMAYVSSISIYKEDNKIVVVFNNSTAAIYKKEEWASFHINIESEKELEFVAYQEIENNPNSDCKMVYDEEYGFVKALN